MASPKCFPALVLAVALGFGCGDRSDRPETARVDPATRDTSALGDPSESAFIQWWRVHARTVSLRLPQPEPDPPVAELSRYALAGADTTVVGSPEPVDVLDLERVNAKLADIEGRYQVYAFPAWERQLKLWVPEPGDDCAKQRAALVIGSGQPTFFELNPLCPAANVPYDLDGVSITAYYPRPGSAPWLEFAYQTPPCAPLYLFRWSEEHERIDLIQAVRTCQDVPPAQPQ